MILKAHVHDMQHKQYMSNWPVRAVQNVFMIRAHASNESGIHETCSLLRTGLIGSARRGTHIKFVEITASGGRADFVVQACLSITHEAHVCLSMSRYIVFLLI